MAEELRTELADLLTTLRQKLGDEKGSSDTQEVARELDRYLSMLRDAIGKLAKQGKKDIFVQYLFDKLEQLSITAVDAANKSILRVSEHQFPSVQALLEAFGSGERILRYTWRIDPSEPLFGDDHWLRHFKLTSSLAAAGDLEVRAILVAKRLNDYEATNVRTLLEFFASQEGMNAKPLLDEDYSSSATDHAVPPACVEFGIYGESLLYQADTYEPVSIGCWSKEKTEISRYRRFFDALWNRVAGSNPVSVQQMVRLSQLVAVDGAFSLEDSAREKPKGVRETIDSIDKRMRSAMA